MTDPEIQFADLAERHPERYNSEPPTPVPCAVCGEIACTDEHPPPPRRTTKARPPRRVDQEPTRDPEPTDDPDRLVIAKADLWEEFYAPGCVTPTNVKRVAKGQQLPLSEAEQLGVEWAEHDGAQSFGIAFKDGIPVFIGGPHIEFDPEPIGKAPEVEATGPDIDYDAPDPF